MPEVGSMSDFGWTAEQVRAITAEGHTLLAASAGTGKTTTIVGKILWLLGLDVGPAQSGESLPACPRPASLREIAAITFTEKAAYDLKRKLRREIEASADSERLRWEIDRASVGTIHAFCAEILRETALRFGIDPSFRVLDEREARVEIDGVIKDVLFEGLEAGERGSRTLLQRFGLRGFTNVDGTIDHVRKVLRDLRWHRDRYDSWLTDGAGSMERLVALDPGFAVEEEEAQLERCQELLELAMRAEERWQAYLRRENLRDFDSLILDARSLLTGPEARPAIARLQRRFRVLIIDEFQDTDAAQRDIAFAIAGLAGSPSTDRDGPQLFLVGDAKQSIYGFRGADISVWNETRQVVCQSAGPLELTRNFRSDPAVIAFANAAAGRAVGEIGEAVAGEVPESHVAYSDLVPGRQQAPAGGVEWLAADTSPVARQRDAEAEHVATRIVEMVGHLTVQDPETGAPRPCRFRDIAILYRNTTGLEQYERALRRYGIPFFSLGITGFAEAQEILDLVTAIRVIDNPRDDLRAFAFLRSPFVGLRDEVIARLRIEGGHGSLLRQAYRFAEQGSGWFAHTDDDERIAGIERESLIRGLDAIKRARQMAGRAPLDELLSDLLEHTGYRLHLLLTERSAEALANIEKFLTLLEDYRDRPLGTFLEIWDRWDDLDTLVPQAPLYSKEDDVVTLSTIHGAKGLEWPLVFLVGTGQRFSDRLTNQFWSDPEFGPVLCPKRDERTARSSRLHARRTLAERAEEARLLYVAVTRARDRLLVVGRQASSDSYAGWLSAAQDLVEARLEPAKVPSPDLPPEVRLDWMDGLEGRELASFSKTLPMPQTRFTTSATEAMKRERDTKEWAQRYLHGIIETWRFAPHSAGEGSDLPPTERGKLIHDVLERIREEEELAELLDERIGAADALEIEATAAPGTAYREALEKEIRDVIRGEKWQWYVDGEHYRELRFIRLGEPTLWEVGALDLYRPSRSADGGGRDATSWIIDFKTHQIGETEIEATARRYQIQGDVYRAAGTMRDHPRVLLHFTHPNRVTELVAGDEREEQARTLAGEMEESVAAEAQLGVAESGDGGEQLLLFD
jgi:ATP-dependent helicase/nuclease subunit A